MKILVLNGSPKKENSDTLHMTNAFLKGMNEVGDNDIKIIHVIDKNINYCSGCFTCKRNGGTCIYHDDMKDIMDDILNTDLLILSFPLYCYGLPAPLKVVMDRTMPLSTLAMKKEGDRYLHVDQRDFSKLKYLMICGCGFPNSKNNFEPMINAFELMFPHNHTIITVPESPLFNVEEAKVVTNPRLELLKEAGKEYMNSGTINDKLLKEISSPMIPEDVYASIVNNRK